MLTFVTSLTKDIVFYLSVMKKKSIIDLLNQLKFSTIIISVYVTLPKGENYENCVKD